MSAYGLTCAKRRWKSRKPSAARPPYTSSWSTSSIPAPSNFARLSQDRAPDAGAAAAGVVAASNETTDWVARPRRRGIAAEVYVSAQVSPAKAQRIAAYGAVVRQAGNHPLAAELAARRAAETSGRVFISPYNDLDVVAGQGTIAVELHRQVPHLDAVFVAVGGGGLIGGIAAI